jgi:hypothetical protein
VRRYAGGARESLIVGASFHPIFVRQRREFRWRQPSNFEVSAVQFSKGPGAFTKTQTQGFYKHRSAHNPQRFHSKTLPLDALQQAPRARKYCCAKDNLGGTPRVHWWDTGWAFLSTKWRLFHCRQPLRPSQSHSRRGALWGSPDQKSPPLGASNPDYGQVVLGSGSGYLSPSP